MSAAFRAALFDLDGVLVDSARLHFIAWKRIADELGIGFTEHDNEALKGVDRLGSLDLILALGGRTLGDAERAATAERKNGYYVEALATMGRDDILPGAEALIARTRAAGLKLAVASASRNAKAVLDRVGLLGAFDYVADSGKVARSKPAPDIFLACAEALDVLPTACVGFEDAAAGVAAINAAGMTSVGIGDPAILADAALIFPSTAAIDLDRVLALPIQV